MRALGKSDFWEFRSVAERRIGTVPGRLAANRDGGESARRRIGPAANPRRRIRGGESAAASCPASIQHASGNGAFSNEPNAGATVEQALAGRHRSVGRLQFCRLQKHACLSNR